ncbi:S4 domain-containing protein [Paracoccaceae bacterium]|nr:S4 domain-containing protein [Paracoccaceae bacterium]
MTFVEKLNLSQCRLDAWLWAARFYKTRSLAVSNIKKGLVRLSGKTITKPSSPLSIGSLIVIEQNLVVKTILVEEIALKRVSFAKAKKFYSVISKESSEVATFFRAKRRYKPDKKVRRSLKALKERLHFLSDN